MLSSDIDEVVVEAGPVLPAQMPAIGSVGVRWLKRMVPFSGLWSAPTKTLAHRVRGRVREDSLRRLASDRRA